MTKEELWQAVLAQIQLNISQANFDTWFKNTAIIGISDGVTTISVSNAFAKEWFQNKYHKTILKTLHGLDESIKDICYVIGRQELKHPKRISVATADNNQLDFQELKIDKETNLNPRYSFENFIVGPFNELPHAAAWAVSQEPGSIYNPLFVYGGVGLGKTHLVQSIGNEILKNFSSRKVKYIPAEKFISEVVMAIKNHSMEGFKSKYRAIDVLIIDDIQFLAGKEKTQEEFFHTFNALYEKNRQVILSSDRPPKAIPSLAERLRSRFEGGMIADIGYPDFETRLAILKSKAQEKNINLPEELFTHLATKIQRNIRELEGALNRLVAHQRLSGQLVDVESAKVLLKKILLSPAKTASPKKIIQSVAEFYDLREKTLLESSRKREVVRPRQIAMYILREDLKSSYPFIGRKLGGKDHTTAIHAYEKISKEVESNEGLKEEIDLIRQVISSS